MGQKGVVGTAASWCSHGWVLRGPLWTVSHGHVGMGTQYGQIVRVSFLKATFWILCEVSHF